MEKNFGNIRSFVLRNGKISYAQKRSYEKLFPFFGITGNNPVTSESLFGSDKPLVIEIGFGMGRATAEIAYNNPDINYIGIEVHKPGIGRLLWDIERLGIKNIRIAEEDARVFLTERINDNSVSAFHIFFPDPWPKKKHNKRRLLARPFTDLLAVKLLSGGYIYAISDWEDYADEALKVFTETPGLKNKYNGYADRQDWRPITEFEKKGLQKNHVIREMIFTGE